MADALIMPRLAADGFVLRAFEFGDVPLIQEASADPFIPLVTTVPTNPSRDEAVAFIERQHSRCATGAGYSFVADCRTRWLPTRRAAARLAGGRRAVPRHVHVRDAGAMTGAS